MATMLLESAVLASCGNIVLLTWRAAAPAFYSTPDWLEGYNAGRWFDVAGRTVVRHLNTGHFIAQDGSLEWQTFLRIGVPIVYGTASAVLNVDSGLLTDSYGNTNAGVTNFAIDVTRTLVDSTSFLDPNITPGAGGVKVYIDPVGGLVNPTLGQIQTVAGACRTFKKATEILEANGLQGNGCHILYLPGRDEVRDHTAPYNDFRTFGPSPNKPCIITVCAADGTPATSGNRAKILLSNPGVPNGYLAGFVRDTGGPTDCPNVYIGGFEIRNTDTSGTATGGGVVLLKGTTNFTCMDMHIERMLQGFEIQESNLPAARWMTIARNKVLDSLGIGGRRSFGLYTNYCAKGMVVVDNHFDRNAKVTTDLLGGDAQLRDIYVTRYGHLDTGGEPTGPTLIAGGIHMRGQDTTVQNREGPCAGMLFVDCPGAGHNGGRGGGGWNMTAIMEAGDFIQSDGTTITGSSRAAYINNSIRDSVNQLSEGEGSNGGILEACCMYPRAGTAPFNELAFSIAKSNWNLKKKYILRHNVTKGVGPQQMDSEIGYPLGNVRQYGNVVDARGSISNRAIRLETDMTSDGWAWLLATNNIYCADDNNQAVFAAFLGNVYKSLDWYKALTGTDLDLQSSPAPTYLDSSRSIGTWAGLNGLTATKAAFIDAVRTRAYRTWHAAFDAFAAVEYFLAGLEITNRVAFTSGWFNKHGAPQGLPTAKKGSSGTPPMPTTPTSTKAAQFHSGRVNPVTQVLDLTIGDSNIDLSTTNTLITELYYFGLPWNGAMVPPSSGYAVYGYSLRQNVGTDVLQAPGTASGGGFIPTVFADGSSGHSPIPFMEISFPTNADQGTTLFLLSYWFTSAAYEGMPFLEPQNNTNPIYGPLTLNHAVIIRESAKMIPAVTLKSGRGATYPGGGATVAYTKPGSPTGLTAKVAVGTTTLATAGTGEPNITTECNHGVVVSGTNSYWQFYGTHYQLAGVTGVHLMIPHAQGGYRIEDHLDTTICSNAGLDASFNACGWPTHIRIRIGQNLTSAMSTALNTLNVTTGLGDYSTFKAGLLAIIARYEARFTANSKPLPLWELETTHRSGYNAIVPQSQAQAMYEIATENARVSHINTYLLSGAHTIDNRSVWLDGGGVHTNPSGKQAFAQLRYREVMKQLGGLAFRHLDQFVVDFTAGNAPVMKYRMSAATLALVSASGGSLVMAPGAGVIRRRKNISDHVWGDQYTQVKLVTRPGGTSTLDLYLNFTSLWCNYRVRFTLTSGSNAYAITRGGPVAVGGLGAPEQALAVGSGTGTQAIVFDGTHTLRVESVTDPVTLLVTITLKYDGVAFKTLTLTAAESLVFCGETAIGFSVGSGTMAITDWESGPLGAIAPAPSDYLGRAPQSKKVKLAAQYVETFDGAESETQAKVKDVVWCPGSYSADLLGWFKTIVAAAAAYPDIETLYIRGLFGHNNSIGYRAGIAPSNGAVAAGQNLTQILCARSMDDYLDSAKSRFTTSPADGRLVDGVKSALLYLTRRFKEVVIYGGYLPSGTPVDGTVPVPLRYPGTTAAFLRFLDEILDVGAVSKLAGGGGISYGIDVGLFNPGGAGGARPVENDNWYAFMEYVFNNLQCKLYVEPPTFRETTGGSSANLAYFYKNGLGIIGASDPTLANDVVARGIDSPTLYMSKSAYAPGQEAVAWVTGAWMDTAARRNAAKYYTSKLYTTAMDLGGMSAAQVNDFIASARAAIGGDGDSGASSIMGSFIPVFK